ncbi:MAG: xanthine dehydrogenase family protein subunit M [Acidimicrobiia bacterium]
MTPEKFRYFAPRTVDEALALLSEHGERAKILAGGQSLLAAMKLRLASPEVLIDLGQIRDLDYIRRTSSGLSVGAMTPYVKLLRSALVADVCSLVAQAAKVIGDVQIRNRGTIGGTIAHADPSADMPAAVLAIDAKVVVRGPEGERVVPAPEFFISTFTTALEPDEIVTEVRLPSLAGWRSTYLKAARRPSDFAMVAVAAVARLDAGGTRLDDVKIALSGVSDSVFRATSVENAVRGRLVSELDFDRAAAGVTEGRFVLADVHASSAYRAQLAVTQVSRAMSLVVG